MKNIELYARVKASPFVWELILKSKFIISSVGPVVTERGLPWAWEVASELRGYVRGKL